MAAVLSKIMYMLLEVYNFALCKSRTTEDLTKSVGECESAEPSPFCSPARSICTYSQRENEPINKWQLKVYIIAAVAQFLICERER